MSFMTRTKQREHIFKLLFQIDFIGEKEMDNHLNNYLENLDKVSEKDKEAIRVRFLQVQPYISEADKLLDNKVIGWKTKRMNKVDLSILRLAIYEMNYDQEIPTRVAISEAVELANRFSSKEGSSFVNGVLAKIVQDN